MDRSLPLKWSDLLTLLLIGLVLCAAGSLLQINWGYLFHDRQNDQIVPIKQIHVLTTTNTKQDLKKLQDGKLLPSASIDIFNTSLGEEGPNFRSQLKSKAPEMTDDILSKKKSYIFYFDLPWQKLMNIDNPQLAFYNISSDWKLYFDDLLVGKGDRYDEHHFFDLTVARGRHRAIFVAIPENMRKSTLGLSSSYGLTIRSQLEAKKAVQWLPVQHNFLRFSLFLILALMAKSMLTLYFNNMPREYRDVPAFALMTGFLGLLLLMDTSLFYDSFVGRGKVLGSIRQYTYCAVVIASTFLTATFLRVENDRKINIKLLLFLFSVFCIGVTTYYLRLWHPTSRTSGVWLSVSAFFMNLTLIGIGIKRLLEARRENISKGYPELNQPFLRRYVEISLYGVSLAAMAYVYGWGYHLRTLASGKDYWVVWGLVPTTIIYYQLQFMVSRATSESKQLRGKLSLLERLITTEDQRIFNRNFDVVIAAFDVKGFSTMQLLEWIEDSIREPLMGFIYDIGSYFEKKIEGVNQFHKQDLGDEWIFLFRGRNSEETKGFLKEVYDVFDEDIDHQVELWRVQLRGLLEEHDVDKQIVNLLVDNFTVHSMLLYADDLRISPGSGRSEKGSYKSPMFSLLKGVDKDSTHDKIAMYQSQVGLLGLGDTARFELKESKVDRQLRTINSQDILGTVAKDVKMGLLDRSRYKKSA